MGFQPQCVDVFCPHLPDERLYTYTLNHCLEFEIAYVAYNINSADMATNGNGVESTVSYEELIQLEYDFNDVEEELGMRQVASTA